MTERAKTFRGFPQHLRPTVVAEGSRVAGEKHESKRIHTHVSQLSRWMDAAFEVPVLGWRFGWDALIGLLPGVGDTTTMLVSIYIVGLAAKAGVSRITIARMGLNVAIDMLIGSIPFVGDLFDVWWKANVRNTNLLAERLAEDPPATRRAQLGDWLFVGLVILGLVLLFAAIIVAVAWTLGALWSLAAR